MVQAWKEAVWLGLRELVFVVLDTYLLIKGRSALATYSHVVRVYLSMVTKINSREILLTTTTVRLSFSWFCFTQARRSPSLDDADVQPTDTFCIHDHENYF